MKFTNYKMFLLVLIVLFSLILSIKLNNYVELTTANKESYSSPTIVSKKDEVNNSKISKELSSNDGNILKSEEIKESTPKRLQQTQSTTSVPTTKPTCQSDEVWNILAKACQKILEEYHPNQS